MILRDENFRIVYVPPIHIASLTLTSPSPELDTLRLVHEFIIAHQLAENKPDFRHLGFESRNRPGDNMGRYTRWISAPKDITVAYPFEAAIFTGGLYAACSVPLGRYAMPTGSLTLGRKAETPEDGSWLKERRRRFGIALTAIPAD